MIPEGSVITLKEAKSHGEGQDAMRLSAGACGMIVQIYRKHADDNHEYVVDFGPYGQWYCYQNEMQYQESHEEEREEFSTFDIPGFLAPPPNGSRVDQMIIDEMENEPSIDVDADIKRRMKEIENGSY